MAKKGRGLGQEGWEQFDARKLFAPPKLHAKRAVVHEPEPDMPRPEGRRQRDDLKETDEVHVTKCDPWEERDDSVELDADETLNAEDLEGEEEPQEGEGEPDSDEPPEETSEGEMTEGQPQYVGSGLAEDDWERRADASAATVQMSNIKQYQIRSGNEQGHETSEVYYDFDRYIPEMEIAFRKGRELVRKMANEVDFSARTFGAAHWDAAMLAKYIVSLRHSQLPDCKYDRPREADIVMLMDISGSCAAQAEMFMAISAGAVGRGVRIHTGFNGVAKREAMMPPARQLTSYAKGLEWVKREQVRQRNEPDALSFKDFVKLTQPKTCIIFGDWDGRQEYRAVRFFRNIRFYWFCNYGVPGSAPPDPGIWSKKRYFPAVYTPADLVRCLKKLRT